VKVLDFGLAKQVTADEATGLTKTGVAVGTPRYISPEAVKGEQLDGRSDLYCLGAVAYWMLTGRPPFESSSSVELLIDHVKATPPKISEISEVSIPPQLEAVVMRCLEKDRSDRFVTAEALEAALREIAFEEPWTQAKALAWWELHGLKIEQQAVPSEDATDESESHGRGISRFFIEP
jgi:serine/threonine-protein kinase